MQANVKKTPKSNATTIYNNNLIDCISYNKGRKNIHEIDMVDGGK